MKRRQNLREQKKQNKNMLKLRRLMGDQLMQKQLEIEQDINGNKFIKVPEESKTDDHSSSDDEPSISKLIK